MPLEYTIDHERRRVFVLASNPLTHEQGKVWIADQAREGAWTYDVIEDLRGVDWLPPPGEIDRLSDYVDGLVRQYGQRGRVAIVVDEHDSQYGMLRMYSAMQERIRVFVTFDDAEAWLASPPKR